MELEVYDKPVNRAVLLALFKRGEDISLCVVNEYGERVEYGELLKICENGTIKPIINVNPDFGFQLDQFGCVRVS